MIVGRAYKEDDIMNSLRG